MLTDDADQPAADQQRQRILHGTAREADGDSDAAMAGLRAAAFPAAGLRPKLEARRHIATRQKDFVPHCRRPGVQRQRSAPSKGSRRT